MTTPVFLRALTSSSLPRLARHPGTDSSLSSVPPVCPRPRPDSCGTTAPQLATRGASTRLTLSPTPPVECLSTEGFPRPLRSRRSPEAIISAVHARRAASSRPLKQRAISSAAICSSATSPFRYAAKSQEISRSVSGRSLSRFTRISDTASGNVAPPRSAPRPAGAAGPGDGPAGAAGPAGADGPAGAEGPAGAGGVAVLGGGPAAGLGGGPAAGLGGGPAAGRGGGPAGAEGPEAAVGRGSRLGSRRASRSSPPKAAGSSSARG